MNKRLIDSLVLSTTIIMLLSLIPMFPVHAVAGPEIYLDPAANNFDTGTTSPCYKWPITIWIKNLTTPVFAWQVLLQIQDAPLDWINITSAWNEVADPAYIFYGKLTQCGMPVFYDFNIDGHNEEVKLAQTLQGGQVPTSGMGPFKLATVVLHLTRAPGKYENFHVNLITDNIDTFLLDDTLNEIYPLNKYGGYVDYDWSLPTTIPTVTVEDDFKPSAGYIFDCFTNWTDPAYSDFDVELYIENLEVGWALHNATFSLHYNTTLFAVVAVVVDPAWAGPNNVGVVPGTISIFVQGHPAPAGNVLVATVTFRILYQETSPPLKPPIETELAFTDITLWNTVTHIQYLVINGRITIEPYAVRDVSVINVTPSKTVVGQGYCTTIGVTVENQGCYGTFNVTTYYNATVIETRTVTNLPSGEETTITFTWNTTGAAKGNYTITAKANPVPGETDTADNTLADGWVIVAMVGDITGPDGWPDGKCDIRDIAAVAILFGVNYPNPRYDPNCDLTGPTTGVADGKIDIKDMATVAIHYGEIDP